MRAVEYDCPGESVVLLTVAGIYMKALAHQPVLPEISGDKSYSSI